MLDICNVNLSIIVLYVVMSSYSKKIANEIMGEFVDDRLHSAGGM